MWDYRDLDVWRQSRSMVADVYRITLRFPDDERFGLVAQMRRAAVSVTANIAEGCGRRGRREFARFVDMAIGSAFELECHLLVANDLGFVSEMDAGRLLEDVDHLKRRLINLAKSLRTVT